MKALKSLLIDDLLQRVNASPFLFVVDYTGLKVDKFAPRSTSSKTTL